MCLKEYCGIWLIGNRLSESLLLMRVNDDDDDDIEYLCVCGSFSSVQCRDMNFLEKIVGM